MPRPSAPGRPDGRKKARNLPPRAAEILAEYKTYLLLELGRVKNTADSYLSDIALFCEFAGKRMESFADVDADLLSDWLAAVSRSDKPSTQSRKLSAMRSLARFLMEEGIWDKNICDLFARPKTRRAAPEILETGEIEAMVSLPPADSPEGVRDRAMMELMYSSGLRVSELCSVSYADIDSEQGIIRVRGKGGKTRLVPVGGMALEAVEKYRAVRPLICKKPSAPELFITRRGKKISRKTFWYNLKKYARLSGVEKGVKPHMLRHSFATHLLRNGANLMLIREMLGHSDLSTTQIYTNLANDDIRREYEKKHPRSKMDVEPGV